MGPSGRRSVPLGGPGAVGVGGPIGRRPEGFPVHLRPTYRAEVGLARADWPAPEGGASHVTSVGDAPGLVRAVEVVEAVPEGVRQGAQVPPVDLALVLPWAAPVRRPWTVGVAKKSERVLAQPRQERPVPLPLP